MRCLLDNNIPRSVRSVLRAEGFSVLEVREALAQDAPDGDVAAYAARFEMIVFTHDRGLAKRALALGVPHVWLRTREADDARRLADEVELIEREFETGAARLVVFKHSIRREPPTT